MNNPKDAIRAMQAAETNLTRTRASLASARAVVASHEAVCRELESHKRNEILKAGGAGKLPVLTDLNHRLSAALAQLAESNHVLSTLMEFEAESIRVLAHTEKEASDAVQAAWDSEADRAREDLIRVAAPALSKLYKARFNSNSHIAIGTLLRSTGLLSDLETAAEQAEVTFDPGLPECVVSSLLTHEERSAGLRRAA